MDRLSADRYQQLARELNGIPVSAKKQPTLRPLVKQIRTHFKNCKSGFLLRINS